MTTEITITDADNGMLIVAEDFAQVIENTHTDIVGNKDNLIRELGNLFYGVIMGAMNDELYRKIKVKIETSKAKWDYEKR